MVTFTCSSLSEWAASCGYLEKRSMESLRMYDRRVYKKFRCGHLKAGNTYCYKKTTRCKICRRKSIGRWIKRNPRYVSQANTRRRERAVSALMKKQKGCCAICKREMRHPYRDHNHACCSIVKRGGCPKCRRGLLCPSCNGGLHLVESTLLHKAAIAYLKKWRAQ